MKVAAFFLVAVATVGSLMRVGAVCTGGIVGVESTSDDVCCVEDCGECGGVGCAPDENSTLTANDCCATEILESGIFCNVSSAAPCILTASSDSNSTCSNGFSGIEDDGVCCDSACGQCGGSGCGSIPGLTGDDCCSSIIASNGTLCSETESAPCIIDIPDLTVSNSTCSNGFSGIQDDDPLSGACCDPACGQCGGAGCGTIPGLTSDDCCSSTIIDNGTFCSEAGSAPCIIDLPEVNSSTCPNGLAGVSDDSVCCAEACNLVCGGEGCGSIYGTAGASDCCSSSILEAGVFCEDGVVAPCIMVNGTYTPAPSITLETGSPTTTPRVISLTTTPSHTPTVTPFELIGISPTTPTTSAPTSGGMLMTLTPTTIPASRGIPTAGPTEAPASSTPTGAPTLAAPTGAPTFVAPTGAPTLVAPTGAPTSFTPTGGPTSADTPMGTPDSTSSAAIASTGNLIALTAIVTGTFAVFAASRD